MDIKRGLFILLAVSLIGCSSNMPSTAAELSKVDSVKLLTSMGRKNIVVAAVIDGIGVMGLAAFSSPNAAFVTGYAEVDGKPTEINQTFFYDKEIGWFWSEVDTSHRRVRLWTTTGYKELRPAEK
jgi:hypothetical protein